MKRRTAIIGSLMLLAGAGAAFAHEGHTHTMRGTVTAVRDSQLHVKTVEGKDIVIALNEKTKVLRGKNKLTLTDLVEGQRVVVDVGNGKSPLVAREVRVGAAEKTTAVAVGSK